MRLTLLPLAVLSLAACSDAAPLDSEPSDSADDTDDTAPVVGHLALNEVSPAGDFVDDDAGDPGEDWIEIVAVDGPVDLGGHTLTDGSGAPWELPPIVLAADELRLVWCDDDGGQGVWHASFKLASEGEHLVLASADGPIDETTVPAAVDGQTWARAATGAWAWAAPTPGLANGP